MRLESSAIGLCKGKFTFELRKQAETCKKRGPVHFLCSGDDHSETEND